MHIDDQTYSVNGKKYRRILLRNSYRKNGKVNHDTIANLSKSDKKEVEAIKFALANKNKLDVLKAAGKKIKTQQGLCVGAVWLLHQLAKRLGIVKALGREKDAKLVLWMIISCVIGCVSRLSVTRLAQRHAACDILNLDSFCEDDLYKALDWLSKKQPTIEKRLFNHTYSKKKPDLFLYDVTSSYLEGDQNELGDYGYGRDGKKGKKQIVIGLLTDDEGRPVSCEVFRGNTSDLKTFKNQVDKVARRLSVERVTFVGDRGMIKSTQIEDLKEEDFYYITAISKAQIKTLIKSDIIQMELFDENVYEVDFDDIRYVLRRNPERMKQLQACRENKLAKIRQLCTQKNQYLSEHPRAKVETAKRIIEGKAKKLKVDKWIGVENKGRCLNITVDTNELEEEQKFDGCYVIKTNLPKEDVSKEIVHDRYKSLAEVEWAFRTMKTTLLHIRGIFLRKANRTRAHAFILMLAYLLAYELRRLWQKLEVTVGEGIEELASICSTDVVIGSATVQTIPEPRPLGKRLLEAAKITLPDAMPSKHVTVVTRKKLVEERRTNSKSDYYD